MTIYLRRQIAGTLGEGTLEALQEAELTPYRCYDVLPKISLILEEGKFTQDSISLAATKSYTVPLPNAYDPATRLSVTIRSTERCKVVIVTPSGTNTFLIKATSSSAEGDHKGVLLIQDFITSITLSVPTAFDAALLDWFIWEVPDIDVASSYRIGNRAFGYVVGNE